MGVMKTERVRIEADPSGGFLVTAGDLVLHAEVLDVAPEVASKMATARAEQFERWLDGV